MKKNRFRFIVVAILTISIVNCANDESSSATTAASAACSPVDFTIPSNLAAPAEANEGGADNDTETFESGNTAAIGNVTVTYDGTYWEYDLSSYDCVAIVGSAIIGSGVELKFGAGTTVLADNTQLSYLSIRPGAALYSVGTSSSPIVFTSGASVGSRASSDWGGIVIHGSAPANGTAGELTVSDTEVQTGSYGGSTAADSSGTIQYTRIEFAGYEIAAGKEFNGLFLAGVGSGTTIDHIQVHRGSDDGIEIFGGTVNITKAVLTYNDDDSFDLDEGWMGYASHFMIAQGSEAGDFAIEYDGLGKDASRATQSIFSNFTILGEGNAKSDDDDLITVKASGAVILVNSLFSRIYGQFIDHQGEVSSATDGNLNHFVTCGAISAFTPTGAIGIDCASGSAGEYLSALSSNYFEDIQDGSGTAYTSIDSTFVKNSSSAVAVETAFDDTPSADNNVVVATAAAYTTSITNYWGENGASDFMPAANVATGNSMTLVTTDATAWNNTTLSLSGINYVGAIDPSGSNWLDGWTSFPAN